MTHNYPQRAGDSAAARRLRDALSRAYTEKMAASRVLSAQAALDAFGSFDAEDLETSLADLLANLMHYADAHGFDFEDCLVRANDYHDNEKEQRP